jgi:hypothetical protein
MPVYNSVCEQGVVNPLRIVSRTHTIYPQSALDLMFHIKHKQSKQPSIRSRVNDNIVKKLFMNSESKLFRNY